MKIVIKGIFNARERYKRWPRPGLFEAKENSDIIKRIYYNAIQLIRFPLLFMYSKLIHKEQKRPSVLTFGLKMQWVVIHLLKQELPGRKHMQFAYGIVWFRDAVQSEFPGIRSE